MRKGILLLLFTIFSLSLYAQNDRGKTDFNPHHDFRFGIGYSPTREFEFAKDSYYYPNSNIYDNIEGSRYRIGARYESVVYNLAYTYRLKKWFELGATASYYTHFNSLYNRLTDRRIGSDRYSNFTITPMARFTWVRGRIVRLYSEVGFSISALTEKNRIEDNINSETNLEGRLSATLFGISVGKKYFGYFNLWNFGSTGVVAVGLGYRF